ncbi:CHAD domain-containing protein [Kocuria dechangensis]|uniref:CHAD domain-containing protein n=1 Tax=Kocuria dechangensis TaxID=1176249 RepID=A0A917M1Y9_9MICC|nr:CYTH and CHAD domain-containing protein [Kocuria dechangensis]GGG72282.1 CHAD domain-containing protein [Kocuria dechangensis]
MAVTAQREIERKYELPEGSQDRVDWSVLQGYTVMDAAVEHRMEAVYYDTAEMTLDRHHVALRRRRGGADDGWHVKLREADGRYEAHIPLLEKSPERMPAAVRHLVEGLTGGQPLEPIATLATTRRVLTVAEDSGAPVAEIAIDDVAAVDERHGSRRVWSEWEVELTDGTVAGQQQERIFTALEQALFAAGGTPSASSAKIARAIGAEDSIAGDDEVPVPADPETAKTTGTKAGTKGGKKGRKKATGADVLVTVLGQLAEQLMLWDLKVRLDVPDAVHQMRVTSRSLRSMLKAAAPLFDGEAAAQLDGRLRELARSLSPARDAEVTAELLPQRVQALDGRLDPGAIQVLQRTAEEQAAAAAATVRRHLQDKAHLQLLADVQAFAADPPLAPQCEKLTSRKASTKMLRRALRKVQRVGDRGVEAEDSGAEADPAHRLEHLHQVRKDVKRVRYVNTVLKDSGFTPGKAVRHAAADAKQYQQVLGEIMDAGVVAGWLGRTAEAFKGTGQDRYAVGVLHGAELVAVRTGIEDGHEVVTELLARLRTDLS